MSPSNTDQQAQLSLPKLIFGVAAVHQLLRELETLEGFMRQEEIRQPGQQAALPKTSRMLEALAAENRCNLLLADHRNILIQFVKGVSGTAPTVHISFASDPSAAFTGKIVDWLRINIHPLALVQVGLQPSIAAGCIVRTQNKIFDFSLRHRLDEQKELLITVLNEQEIPAPQAVAAQETQMVGGLQV